DRYRDKDLEQGMNSPNGESRKNAASESALRRVERENKKYETNCQQSEGWWVLRWRVRHVAVTIIPLTSRFGHAVAQRIDQLCAILLALLTHLLRPHGIGRQ